MLSLNWHCKMCKVRCCLPMIYFCLMKQMIDLGIILGSRAFKVNHEENKVVNEVDGVCRERDISA